MAINLTPDVLVCGAGCAGIGAALAAARNGAKALVIERAPFAGGIISCAGLPFFDGIARKKDNVILVRGIPVELLAAMGVCKMGDEKVARHNAPITCIEHFKLHVDRLFRAERNLTVLYHAFAVEASVKAGRIEEVVVATKGGLMRIRPRTVIDTTGDADIAARAEVPLDTLKESMPMSLHFRIGNVKVKPETRVRAREVVVQAHKDGLLKSYYGPGLSFLFASDEAYIHAIRITADATDPEDLTRAEMHGREDAWTMWDLWKKNVPGFEDAYYISSGPYIGIRESRRIAGQYILTENDIKEERQFDDAVATGCWYLDLHPSYATTGSANVAPGALGGLDGYQPDQYDIPYRSLQPKKISNLLVAGRCHSATRLAASSTRVTVTAMAMGQAAGVAAALASELRKSTGELDGRKVRDRLTQQHMGPYRGSV